ncbi:aminodeoxychorismate lyase [Glaciecola siphonariae]|uniref:Aminodeoxychorismate lyase n=1 Tax=Glaciecola siphonariae TaxID=521012 RepID=A0ABV9LRZ4_9ALTE
MPNSEILINPANITLSDRSVQYGDASFTSAYAQNGQVVLFDEHMQRLKHACEVLNIEFDDWTGLQRVLKELASSGEQIQVLKVLISRGSGGRGYEAPKPQQTRCIITRFSGEPMHGLADVETLGVSDVPLPSHIGMTEIKHNNRLAQVIARSRSTNMGCEEVLMCNESGQVIEASSANIFYRLNGAWHTPPLHRYGVRGVMRDAFIAHLSQQGIYVNQATHHIRQFSDVECVLLSNAVKGIRAVKTLVLNSKKHALNVNADELIKPFLTKILASPAQECLA